MSENRMVYHDGVIVGTQGERVQIKIISQSACSECHAKSACVASEMVEKIIDAHLLPGEVCTTGDLVTIEMASRLGRKAIFFAFIVPFLVMATTLFTAFALGVNESIAGICALLSLVPYYLLLKVFNARISRDFIFYARKKM